MRYGNELGGIPLNILLCSVGYRVQLISAFKEELKKVGGKVIAVGCDPTAPALYGADMFEVVPRIDHPEYIDSIKTVCRKYDIKGIIPLIDSELVVLSNVKEEFEKEGIQIIVSDKHVIDLCNDKYKTADYLHDFGIPVVPTYRELSKILYELDNGHLEFPLIVKPIDGNGGRGLHKVENLYELKVFWKEKDNLVIQPFIEGHEYCVECYIDLLTKKNTNLFSKRKLSMRGGETDKAVVVKDCELNELTDKVIEALKPVGPIDIDYFKTKDGYILSEINPRFGGGYPYAYQLGQNFILSIIKNLKGIPNEPYVEYVGQYEEGKVMMRYDQYIILNHEESVKGLIFN